MRFFADLHIHSKYSRATSRDLDLEHLAYWAARKGITVVATGDFTHPAWIAELKEKLIPAEPGLYRLRPEIAEHVRAKLPPSCPSDQVRFLLEVEISTIYKKGDKTRKVHHLIYVPNLVAAERLNSRLDKIGNLKADGRPILGLDSRHLLEIALESDPASYLVPAHIWTPWFSTLGSKSGFDSIEECYGDLSSHIFAVETGLSSDPAMNWRVSTLDRFQLVSNSDAHSPSKLGREACRFDAELNYWGIRKALECGTGFLGTVEFFPEEGKYHLDGHRSCKVRLTPEETRACNGLCPDCRMPVTIGVAHRVDELADRDHPLRPDRSPGYKSLIPFAELIAETVGTSPTSNAVKRVYDRLLHRYGPELHILEELPCETLIDRGAELVGEGLSRMRRGDVTCEAGYDGEYGVVRLFKPGELARRDQQHMRRLFENETTVFPQERKTKTPFQPNPTAQGPDERRRDEPARSVTTDSVPPDPFLDEDQRRVAAVREGIYLLTAGPGSGKTRTVVQRIVNLINDHHVNPTHCLALTFSRRAADEFRVRLQRLLPGHAEEVPVMTFHALALTWMREDPSRFGFRQHPTVIDDEGCLKLLKSSCDLSPESASELRSRFSQVDIEQDQTVRRYASALAFQQGVDLQLIIPQLCTFLDRSPELVAKYRTRHRWIAVDECQDIDAAQFRLMRHLIPETGNLLAIGDPHQSIYGFRGALSDCFHKLKTVYPHAACLELSFNYRSSRTLVDASEALIAQGRMRAVPMTTPNPSGAKINLHRARSPTAEAAFVVHEIEKLLGGHSFFALDTGRSDGSIMRYGFSDIAILYRTHDQGRFVVEALSRSGMPYQTFEHRRLSDRPEIQLFIKQLEGMDIESTRMVDWVMAYARDEIGESSMAELLIRLAESCNGDHSAFKAALALSHENELLDPRADRISLLTLHAGKGLEFSIVFIIGCEDGVIPLKHATTPNEREEERRLFYVGMTRAKERLYLSHAARRESGRQVIDTGPSPFLDLIPQSLCRVLSTHVPKGSPTAKAQLDLF